MKTTYRNALCGELNTEFVGQTVKLCGWTDTRRNLGGVLFIDLRDRSGKVQLRKRLTGPEELGGILKQYFGLENIPYLPPR